MPQTIAPRDLRLIRAGHKEGSACQRVSSQSCSSGQSVRTATRDSQDGAARSRCSNPSPSPASLVVRHSTGPASPPSEQAARAHPHGQQPSGQSSSRRDYASAPAARAHCQGEDNCCIARSLRPEISRFSWRNTATLVSSNPFAFPSSHLLEVSIAKLLP